ncbi:MAG TPA: AMP-binding protein, partial [bacterium]|nr:AMP-binding protein [bacterium]
MMPVVFTSALGMDGMESGLFSSGLDGRVVYGISQTPQVWLDHQVMEQAGALVFNWDVVEGLFPAGMIGDMFAAYRELLGELAGGEEAWEGRRRLRLPDGQLQERELANATAAALPQGLLQDGFLRQAAQHPERTAVVCGERRISYGELRQMSAAVGAWLRARGAEPNRLVAVVMEKGWEQVVAVLGVLQAGAAYLPVEAGLPAARIEYLLRNGEVRLAVTQRRPAGAVTWPEGVEWLVVEEGMETAAGEGGGSPGRAEDLAYVIYTSGSTGEPKGVMIEHRGAVNTIEAVNRRVGMGAGDVVLGVSSLSFDLSVWDIFGTLGAGGRLVLPEAGTERDAERWLELVEGEGVTVWNSVPALMELLVEAWERGGKRQAVRLRAALLSGDWIPVRLPERMQELGVAEETISLGGATEASIWSIWHRVEGQ